MPPQKAGSRSFRVLPGRNRIIPERITLMLRRYVFNEISFGVQLLGGQRLGAPFHSSFIPGFPPGIFQIPGLLYNAPERHPAGGRMYETILHGSRKVRRLGRSGYFPLPPRGPRHFRRADRPEHQQHAGNVHGGCQQSQRHGAGSVGGTRGKNSQRRGTLPGGGIRTGTSVFRPEHSYPPALAPG